MECRDIKTSIDFPSIEVITEMRCYKGLGIISFGAFLFTIPFSLSFLLVKDPENKLWLIALGLSLFTTSSDIFPQFSYLSYLFMFFSLGLIVYGEDEFIKTLLKSKI
jgi:hypothetical protein